MIAVTLHLHFDMRVNYVGKACVRGGSSISYSYRQVATILNFSGGSRSHRVTVFEQYKACTYMGSVEEHSSTRSVAIIMFTMWF